MHRLAPLSALTLAAALALALPAHAQPAVEPLAAPAAHSAAAAEPSPVAEPAAVAGPAAAAEPAPALAPTWHGELRAHAELQGVNPRGPLAEARRLAPEVVGPPRDGAVLEAGLRGQLHGVAADFHLREERFAGGARAHDARVNELHAGGALPGTAGDDGWQWSAGKKIVSWDVGYAFRPNDVVQQERRRLLLPLTPEGRPLLQLERFNLDSAWSLVWTNPQHLHAGLERSAGAEESALALRAYRREGAADWHGFLRWGEHTQGSAGAALAWVVGEALELHASARWMRRHDGFSLQPGAGLAAPAANPWRVTTQGAAAQWLLGFTWTNAERLSVLGELWRDGSAPADAAWDAWGARNGALAALGARPGLPAALRPAVAGQLAWQTTPWGGASLRRDNAFLRLSWQHEHWEPALDLHLTPRDRGRTLTAALAWQGDRWRLEAGLRRHGGPADALLAQLPVQRTGYLAATRAF